MAKSCSLIAINASLLFLVCIFTPAATAYPAYVEEAIKRDDEDRIAIRSAYFCADAINRGKLRTSDVAIINQVENDLNSTYASILKNYKFKKADSHRKDFVKVNDDIAAFYAQEDLVEAGVPQRELCAKDLGKGIRALRKYANIEYPSDTLLRLGLSSTLYIEKSHIYSSQEMRRDRRQAMHYQKCIEFLNSIRAKNDKDFDPAQSNQLMRYLMDLYTEILRQEYPNGKHSQEFIKGIMTADQRSTMKEIKDEGPDNCINRVVRPDFVERFGDLMNKYAKTAKP